MRECASTVLLLTLLSGCSADEAAPYPSTTPVGEGAGEGEGESPISGEGEGGEGDSPLPAGEGEGETGEGEGEGPTGEGEGPVCACASDADCQDGNFCNGAETCSCTCQPGTPPTCADEFECTEDRCADNKCMNVPTHARCGEGKICRPAEGGCVAPPPCRNDADCVPDDPCQTGACDPATRACAFAPFDGDADGHAPRVCGGDDCDDSIATVNPGQDEECNEQDDNCDGQVDEGFDLNSRSHCGSCDNECSAWLRCVNGNCQCQEGLTECGSGCVNLQTDRNNCGRCNERDANGEGEGEDEWGGEGEWGGGEGEGELVRREGVCQEGERCEEGRCRCPEGLTKCGRYGCIDTQTDRDNCGECWHQCGNGAECMGGECACRDPEQTACDDNCTWLSFDQENCGECGRTCPDGAECSEGECRCPDGGIVCEGRCLWDDENNCGACGTHCAQGAECVRNQCVCVEYPLDNQWGEMDLCNEQCIVCNEPDRGAVCRRIDRDYNNCGECGQRCTGYSFCNSGTCECAHLECNGECMLPADRNNCGGCGIRCNVNIDELGVAYGCGYVECYPCGGFNRGESWGYCLTEGDAPNPNWDNVVCTDRSFDHEHCGGCRNACADNEVCDWGECWPTTCDHRCDANDLCRLGRCVPRE